jgi:hypothetical protein
LEGLVSDSEAGKAKTIEKLPEFAIRLGSITAVNCVGEIIRTRMLGPPFQTREVPV